MSAGKYEPNYTVVALAGTSAGAIIATLYWAGLSPSVIRDQFKTWAGAITDGASDILALLGGEPGGRVMSRKAVVSHIKRMRRLTECFGLPLPVSRWPGGAVAAGGLRRVGWRHGGVFPGEVFEAQIDALVRRGVREQSGKPLPAGRPVTFGDLWAIMQRGDAFFPALILTATNLTTGQLVLIDSTDPRFFGVPVARAVRASGGFPLFFAPVPITLPDEDDPTRLVTHHFVDGGVICNYPGFVFANRARADQLRRNVIYLPFAMRPWVNIGLRLEDAPPPPPAAPARAPHMGQVFGPLVGLLTGGTRTILETKLDAQTREPRVVCSCVRDESDPDRNEAGTGWRHKLLDFDKLTPTAVDSMFNRSRQVAAAVLGTLRFDLPPSAGGGGPGGGGGAGGGGSAGGGGPGGPSEVEARMDELVRLVATAFGDRTNAGVKVRATLFVPSDLELVLTYRANLPESDPDYHLRFEYYQGVVGYVFVRRRPALCNLQALAALPGREEWFGLDEKLRGRIRPDRTWLFSTPIYDPDTAEDFPDDNPAETGVPAAATVELDPPRDAALFGVLSVDASVDYAALELPADAEAQLDDPRVQLIRDALFVAAWDLGKLFASRFARSPDEV